MFKKQCLTISVEKKYVKSVVSKIKNILWNHFDCNPEVENFSFSGDEDADISFYFISSDEQFENLVLIIKSSFSLILDIKKD